MRGKSEAMKILRGKFNGLSDSDYEDIYVIFSRYVRLTQRKLGSAVTDEQIKGIVDTVHFSIKNILNFAGRERALR